jgi:hypothetical protein
VSHPLHAWSVVLDGAAWVCMAGCGRAPHPAMGQRNRPAPRVKGAALAGLRPPLTRGSGP